MHISKAGLSELAIDSLNPVQEAAVKAGLLEGKNLVVESPTASGKTLIAEIAFLNHFRKGGKCVYLTPLKALANEKYHDFKAKYNSIGLKVSISIGDFDNDNSNLGRYDVIITSNEKMDSLIRHGSAWINDISLIIVDEIHLLNDPERGPTLEVVLTRLIQNRKSQIVALSATIKNANELADWLNAKLVKSDYRPIKLHKGTCRPHEGNDTDIGHHLEFMEKENYSISLSDKSEEALCIDTIDRGKQALFFVSSRKNAEALAERLSTTIEKYIVDNQKKELNKIANGIERTLDHPTRQCKSLAASVRNGIAFHHAGLVANQRKFVEDNFRSKLIKILVATPTLAYGVNLPAWRVIVRDAKRYSGIRSDFIPVLEMQQIFGRAGRPKYDSDGEALMIAKTLQDSEQLKERYILGEPEEIQSKLSIEPVLRRHVLALIATDIGSRSELMKFLERTLFAKQFGNIDDVMKKVDRILECLREYGFIEISDPNVIKSDFKDFVPAFAFKLWFDKDVKISATPLGKRVSELYIDPQSAYTLISLKPTGEMECILAVCRCAEMRPLIRPKQKDVGDLEESLAKYGIISPDVWDLSYDDFMAAFKTTLMFNGWINELGENNLHDQFDITPGELYNKITYAEWLLYAGRELALLLENNNMANTMNKLIFRFKYGVKDELLKLIQLRGIGRVRARMLYKAGIKSPLDIRRIPMERLEKILGPTLAKSLKEDVEKEIPEKMYRVKHNYRQ